MSKPFSAQSGGRWIAKQNVGLRIFIFLGLLVIGWGPLALFIGFCGDLLGTPHTASTIALVVLYVCFIGLLRQWGQQVHGWHSPLRHCGLRISRPFGVMWVAALLLGLGTVLGLFGFEILVGWATPQATNWPLPGLIIEGLVVAGAIGFAEELLFRGWLLAELEQDLSPALSLGIDSGIFALAHFIKPLSEVLRTAPQFFGLFILGLALVWARRTPSRRMGPQRAYPSGTAGTLGLPMGLHSGLVWGYYMIDAGDLIQYSERVPQWWTGVDNNPLAGLLGLVMLTAIALGFARLSYGRQG